MSRLVLAAVALAATACAQTFTAAAASVNGAEISRAELDEAVEAQLAGTPTADDPASRRQAERDTLTGLIRQQLLVQAAERQGIEATPEAIDAELGEIRSQFGSDADFEQQLAAAGLTLDQLRERLRYRVLQLELAAALASDPSDEEIRATYEQQQAQYQQIQVKHILYVAESGNEAAARNKAERALRVLRARTQTFKALARTSDDPSSAETGGVLADAQGRRPGWIDVAALDAEFGSAAFNAEPGQLVGPVRSQYGFHVIVLIDKRVTPLSQVRDEIAERIKQAGADAVTQELLSQEAARSNILVNPRYGDWDTATQTVVVHESYVPVDPSASPSPADLGGLPIGN